MMVYLYRRGTIGGKYRRAKRLWGIGYSLIQTVAVGLRGGEESCTTSKGQRRV